MKKKEETEKKKYPIGPENYQLLEEVGQGVSAKVHRALCAPFDEVVAIKILDFERDNADLTNISREVQTMILADHPNVVKSHCSFVSDHNLWIVMPFMAGGSCLHILKAAYPDGFEEVVIATILREVLKGLEYLHHHGHIHRDVKAGNILIDGRGAIKLGDFGVSACLFDSGDRQRMRNTFVGTPCWMAPEVMEQLHGYDFKADIWSFGITALELAHGHAPFSKYPPMKVLLMTLQNAPPGLDYERDKKFSKSFKQMIASCLVKDPSKRPSAKKLLKHSFFKQGRSSEYIARTLLEGLPSLGDRMKELKRKEEDMLAQKKMPDGQKEEISQNEYKRGISSWNFNLEDVKAQASLIQDMEDPISDNNFGGSTNSLSSLDTQEKKLDSHISSELEEVDVQFVPPGKVDSSPNVTKASCERFDDESSIATSSSPREDDKVEQCTVMEVNEKPLEGQNNYPQQKIGGQSDHSNVLESIVSPSTVESDKLQMQQQNNSSKNGAPIVSDANDVHPEIPPKASKSSVPLLSDESDEKVKQPVVQQRGRFKVTSEKVEMDKPAPVPVLQKSYSMQVGSTVEVLSQHPAISPPPPPPPQSESIAPALSSHSLFPQLQSMLQANITQRESILNIMKQISTGETTVNRAADRGSTILEVASVSMLEAAHEREKELLHEITELQWRLICAQEEIQKFKTENAQA